MLDRQIYFRQKTLNQTENFILDRQLYFRQKTLKKPVFAADKIFGYVDDCLRGIRRNFKSLKSVAHN